MNLVARTVAAAAAVFYRIDRVGGPLPPGPILVVANHPNSLMDPIVIFRVGGRAPRPLARAPLFRHPYVGPLLRACGALPVYRREDDPSLMDRNEETFRAAVEVLLGGGAVQIFPEGRSHSEPGVVPLRTGAARIALRAEERAGWRLGLRVVPVGLTYDRKAFFRGRVVAAMGAPIPVASGREAYEADPVTAVRALTGEIRRRIEELTLTLASPEERALVETAERLYVREKGWVGWRAREGLGPRLPRLQAFARGIAWLRSNDPERYERFARAVRRYRRQVAVLGAREGDVPPTYRAVSVLRYSGRTTAALLLGLPAASVGAAAWALPYLLPRLPLRLARVPYEAVATWKLGTALLAFPLAYAGWLLLAGWLWGPGGVAVAAVVLPPAGLVTLRWRERWARTREDTRLLLAVLRHPEHRERIAAARAALTGEFDAVRRELDRGPGGPPGEAPPGGPP